MHTNSNMKQITDKFGIFPEVEISQPTAHYIKTYLKKSGFTYFSAWTD